jgi:hypothetical protein
MSGVIVSVISTENIYSLTTSPSHEIATVLLKLNRKQIKLVTELSTKHCKLRDHPQVTGHCEDDSSCIKCAMSDDTSSHIVQECVAVASRRLQLCGDYRLENCHGKNALLSGLLDLTS